MDRNISIMGMLAATVIALQTPALATDLTDSPPQQWRMTKLTGQIVEKAVPTPDMPEGVCTSGKTVYRARLEGSSVHGPTGENEEFMGTEGAVSFDSVSKAIIDTFGRLPGGQTVNAMQSGQLFVFHFEFDNGFHTNDPLLDTNLSALKLESWLGAVSYYVGTWSKSGVVLGIAAAEGPHIQEDRGTTGLGVFEVNGHRDGRVLSGRWQFREAASLMGCINTSLGEGVWEAERGR